MKKGQKAQMASDVLDPTEERLLRMRDGETLPDEQELGRMGEGHPDTLAKLREIEQEAFLATNRIDELRREVGVVVEAEGGAIKSKIIDRLGDVSSEATADAEVSAEVSSKKES